MQSPDRRLESLPSNVIPPGPQEVNKDMWESTPVSPVAPVAPVWPVVPVAPDAV